MGDLQNSYGQNGTKFVAIAFRITGQASFELNGVTLILYAGHSFSLGVYLANVYTYRSWTGTRPMFLLLFYRLFKLNTSYDFLFLFGSCLNFFMLNSPLYMNIR